MLWSISVDQNDTPGCICVCKTYGVFTLPQTSASVSAKLQVKSTVESFSDQSVRRFVCVGCINWSSVICVSSGNIANAGNADVQLG